MKILKKIRKFTLKTKKKKLRKIQHKDKKIRKLMSSHYYHSLNLNKLLLELQYVMAVVVLVHLCFTNE